MNYKANNLENYLVSELAKEASFKKQLRNAALAGSAGYMAGNLTDRINQHNENVSNVKANNPGTVQSEYLRAVRGMTDKNKAADSGKMMGTLAVGGYGINQILKKSGRSKVARLNHLDGFIKLAEEENYLSDIVCKNCGFEGRPLDNGSCPNCKAERGQKLRRLLPYKERQNSIYADNYGDRDTHVEDMMNSMFPL